jgi:hypothetical protein
MLARLIDRRPHHVTGHRHGAHTNWHRHREGDETDDQRVRDLPQHVKQLLPVSS